MDQQLGILFLPLFFAIVAAISLTFSLTGLPLKPPLEDVITLLTRRKADSEIAFAPRKSHFAHKLRFWLAGSCFQKSRNHGQFTRVFSTKLEGFQFGFLVGFSWQILRD
jgi:hypothetical protein